MEFENVRELVLSRQAERIYRTRTEIIVDALQISRIWEEMAEAAALRLDYPEALRCKEAAERWAEWLRPTPQPERSLADGGFNTDGVRGK